MPTTTELRAARAAEIREMTLDQHLAAAAELMSAAEAAGHNLASLTASQRATAHLAWAQIKIASGGYAIVR